MAVKPGTRAVMVKDIVTSNGTVYKNTKIKIEEVRNLSRIRVSDLAGRIFWVKQEDILIK